MCATYPSKTGRAPVRPHCAAATRWSLSFPDRFPIPPECWRQRLTPELVSTEPAPKVLQRALAGERRSGRIVGSSLIAIESVIGGIDEHLDLRVRRGEALDAVDRQHRIALAEMRHHRA